MRYNAGEMSAPHPLGFGTPRLTRFGQEMEQVLVQRPLNRILSFIQCSIDDVVNDPVVKGKVRGYYKLHRQIERHAEITEMERAWNQTRMRF